LIASWLNEARRMYTVILGTHKFSSSDAWVSGKKYVIEGSAEEKGIVVEQILTDIKSNFWISYREGFAPLLNTSYTSDAGWGCMARTAQMMVAMALKRHYLARTFFYDENEIDIKHNTLVSLFCDYPADMCPLSLHNLLTHAHCFNKPVGSWFAPSEACHLVHKCISSSSFQNKIHDLGSVVFTDGTVFLNKLKELFEIHRSLLLLIPLRLGLQEINHGYLPVLRRWMENEYCLGFIGGKPRKSLYFYGYQDERLFYLDPHFTQSTIDIGKKNLETKTYHFEQCLSMHETELDPSLALGFYIPSIECLGEFWSLCQHITENSNLPVLHFQERQPDYSDWDYDTGDEGTEFHEDSSSDDPFVILPDPPPEQGHVLESLSDLKTKISDGVAEFVNATSDIVTSTTETVSKAIHDQQLFNLNYFVQSEINTEENQKPETGTPQNITNHTQNLPLLEEPINVTSPAENVTNLEENQFLESSTTEIAVTSKKKRVADIKDDFVVESPCTFPAMTTSDGCIKVSVPPVIDLDPENGL